MEVSVVVFLPGRMIASGLDGDPGYECPGFAIQVRASPPSVIRAGQEPAAITEKTIDLLREANLQVDVLTVLDAGHNIHFAHFEAFMPPLEQFLIEPAAVS